MEYRRVGDSDLTVSAIGFGTATFGGSTDFYRAWGMNPGGQYAAYHDEYKPFNRADRRRGVPSRIWLHESLLP